MLLEEIKSLRSEIYLSGTEIIYENAEVKFKCINLIGRTTLQELEIVVY